MSSQRKEIQGLLKLAVEAAHAAGLVLRKNYGRVQQIDYKDATGHEINPVTEIDRLAEETVLQVLRAHRPKDDILSEEQDLKRTGSSHLWILDPLDGTVNYAHAYPRFCVSLALLLEGKRSVGVIYDPMMEELFTAARGEGAQLNGQTIHVSPIQELKRSLVCSGFAYDRRERAAFYLSFFKAFIERTHGVRRDGSAALNLAYTAAGRFEGFWEFGLSPWDIAAGCLLVEEAGGRITNMAGGPCELDGKEILASNGLIHEPMISVISEVLSAWSA
ncbi:MAG: inositol monophosphatase [Candidatus Omnitrophica bacterium]|nr:inositol monophosphatase [Candidatus Omnitrophota bacterium]